MAKVSFTKLGCKVSQDIKIINFNEQDIEVKQYLPINEKLQLITNVLDFSEDDNKFSNPVKVNVFLHLEILYRYTNINFTEKQREDASKLYDMCVCAGLIDAVVNAIPEAEYEELTTYTNKIIKAIYKYRNSALGVLESISRDYNETSFDLSALTQQLTDPEALNMLREILPLTE